MIEVNADILKIYFDFFIKCRRKPGTPLQKIFGTLILNFHLTLLFVKDTVDNHHFCTVKFCN